MAWKTKTKIFIAIWHLFLISKKSAANGSESNVELEDTEIGTFRKLFLQKRIIQLGAIQQIKGYDHEKQNKMLAAMTKKIFEILSANRIALEASGMEQAIEDLPKDPKVKDALALVLENTCLAAEVLLNFPNYLHKFLNDNRNSDAVFRWSLSFSHGLVAESIVGENTSKLYKLALMELGVLPKDDGYHNPYLQQEDKPIKKLDFVDPPKPKKKEKKKLSRGPRLAKSEL